MRKQVSICCAHPKAMRLFGIFSSVASGMLVPCADLDSQTWQLCCMCSSANQTEISRSIRLKETRPSSGVDKYNGNSDVKKSRESAGIGRASHAHSSRKSLGRWSVVYEY
ncbi:hypothetical protein GQ54DRAFT_90067 [Martensiomyces pterosporus]|nr:hypothetical protein GQ54DRAFT_90067 [Martensiomyces pterosporus]